MNVLVLDPSRNAYGFALYHDDQIAAWGCIRPDKGTTDEDVIRNIFDDLTALCNVPGAPIDRILAETPIHCKSAEAQHWLSAVWGISIIVAHQTGIPWTGIDPNHAKRWGGFVHKEDVTLHYSTTEAIKACKYQYMRETVADCMLLRDFWASGGMHDSKLRRVTK